MRPALLLPGLLVPALLALQASAEAGRSDTADATGAESGAPAWLSLTGSGLLTLPDATTLGSGRFALTLTVNNEDHDPLGLDLLDHAAAWALGLGPRVEAYGHHVFSRVVSMAEPPALPPPPLDLIVAKGAAVPGRPYYALYAPIPYINRRGKASFAAFVPGDEVLGAKVRLLEPRGLRPGVAVAAEAKLPLSKRPADLASGSGTGGFDCTARLVAEWRRGRFEAVATAGYTRVGAPPFGDRLIVTGSGGAGAGGESAAGDATSTDLPLSLPDRADAALGLRRALSRRLAAALEATTVFEVGARTPTLDRARSVDILGGLQLRYGPARITMGMRYHTNDLPPFQARRSPLPYAVDLTGVSAPDLTSYLHAVGAEAALFHLRQGGQRVLVLAGGVPPLPDGARIIPPHYNVRSEREVGFVLVWAWVF